MRVQVVFGLYLHFAVLGAEEEDAEDADDADFADNFRSTDPSQDLPTAFFAGRLGQVALIAIVAMVGMLIVRSWGLGLAAGGVTVAATMWVTSLTELGDRPIGIADRGPAVLLDDECHKSKSLRASRTVSDRHRNNIQFKK